MAEVAPWLQQGNADTDVAPWLAEKPSVTEDVVKTILPSTAKGILGIPGLPGDMQSILTSLGDRFLPKSNPSSDIEKAYLDKLRGGADRLPTTKQMQTGVEGYTGKFYEPQTGIGKGVGTALEIAPALALGGESLLGTALKSAGAGAASEGAGEAADAMKGYLPKSAQPYAEPVARSVGAVAGSFTPAGARRAITPLPMADDQLAAVNRLRQNSPELVNSSTAGQLTDTAGLRSLEGRRIQNTPQQEQGFTQGIMRQAGSNGMFDTAGLQEAQNVGHTLEFLRNSHTMNPNEYQDLINFGKQERLRIKPQVGQSQPLHEVQTEIARDPTRINAPATDMPGERYGALKQVVRDRGEGAPTTHEQLAIGNVGRRMDQNFFNSMPADEAAHLQDLYRQYSNYKTIENIPTKAGQNTITPNQVFSKAPRGTELEQQAMDASRVMHPLPEVPHEGGVPPWFDLLSSGVLGAAGAAGGGHGGGMLGALASGEGSAVLGHLLAPSAYKMGANTLSRAVSSAPGQAYLGNQAWRPGRHTSSDTDQIVRMLLAPPVNRASEQ